MHSPPSSARHNLEAVRDHDAPLLTVRDVARLDGCSEKTVRRAIAEAHLQAIRIGPGGRLLRITRQAHAAYRSGVGR